MKQVTPNLFEFATSELSQDAFITWLINWSSPNLSDKDNKLYNLAVKFVQNLLNKEDVFLIKDIKCSRQFKNIDVWANINNEYFLVIEDKKATKEHSNQLERYKLIAEDKFKGTKTTIKLVYFKMEEQGNYKNVISNGYQIFDRDKMLNILNGYIKTSNNLNNIVLDYYNYLLNIDSEINSYKTLPIGKWNHNSWKGFYSNLSKTFIESDWNYVANPSGGFMGFWWSNYYGKLNNIEFNYYLQLEENKLIIKIAPYLKKNANELRNLIRNKLYNILNETNLNFKNYGRIGKYMGIMILINDYRKIHETNILDLDKTIKLLKEITNILDKLNIEITAHNTG